MISRVLFLVGGVVLGLAVAVGVLGALAPFPGPAAGVQRWSRFPAACVGVSCVSYAQWAEGIARAGNMRPAHDVLSALLDERVVALVAARAGVRVSAGELDQALKDVRETFADASGGPEVLRDIYGGDPERTLRQGLTRILLREKLAAVGIRSPWEAPNPPRVTVWNLHLRWDGERQTIVERTRGSALAEDSNVR